MRVGVHTSIAGGFENAVHHAKRIGCDTFQMFSANPRGWRGQKAEPEAFERFRAARAASRLSPVVIHANYLINLASSEKRIKEGSIVAFRGEIERALALGADFLVIHPGSAKGSSPSAAIQNCIQSLRAASDGFKMNGLAVLIENTAGQGSAIGRNFEEVAEILDGVKSDLPAGACIDTAHCFESGYPIETSKGLKETLEVLGRTVGIKNVMVIHANDSKTEFNSHADRHEHIGGGKIGAKGFRGIVRHPKLKNIPFICETPLDKPGDDKRNIAAMRRLAGVKAHAKH